MQIIILKISTYHYTQNSLYSTSFLCKMVSWASPKHLKVLVLPKLANWISLTCLLSIRQGISCKRSQPWSFQTKHPAIYYCSLSGDESFFILWFEDINSAIPM